MEAASSKGNLKEKMLEEPNKKEREMERMATYDIHPQRETKIAEKIASVPAGGRRCGGSC